MIRFCVPFRANDANDYYSVFSEIFRSGYYTGEGPLLKQLTNSIADYCQLKSDSISLVANGTLALQLALDALDVHGEVITTPFTYIATSSAILWQKCKPVFVDVDEDNWTIRPDLVEKAITAETKAILATHVFGRLCNIEELERIANKHGIKLIFDASHCFGMRYESKSVFDYGDMSTCSFNATKIFHTAEGGMCVSKHLRAIANVDKAKNFGSKDGQIYGINAKLSELHAALGLVNIKHVDERIEFLKQLYNDYSNIFGMLYTYKIPENVDFNYSYYPVLFSTESDCVSVQEELMNIGIETRRYFVPSLNTVYDKAQYSCPVSESLSRRILCLPMHEYVTKDVLTAIGDTLWRKTY